MQVALFTATMPESLEEVAAEWLRRPERVRISASAASISRSVTQVGGGHAGHGGRAACMLRWPQAGMEARLLAHSC